MATAEQSLNAKAKFVGYALDRDGRQARFSLEGKTLREISIVKMFARGKCFVGAGLRHARRPFTPTGHRTKSFSLIFMPKSHHLTPLVSH